MTVNENNMFEWYEKLYSDVHRSSSYRRYCEKVFGRDFSQQGFSDISQINLMLSNLSIKANQKVLDVCCGTGKLDRFIHELTNADITGIDYSQTAIEIANQQKTLGLSYICTDMDEYNYINNSYDAIFSIDAIFFSSDLTRLLLKLINALKREGILALYYIEIIFDNETDPEILDVDNTPIAKAFKSLNASYRYCDVTDNTYSHMKLKNRIGKEMKDEFQSEGNSYLYEYIVRESIPEDMSLEEFKERYARYLYIYEKR